MDVFTQSLLVFPAIILIYLNKCQVMTRLIIRSTYMKRILHTIQSGVECIKASDPNYIPAYTTMHSQPPLYCFTPDPKSKPTQIKTKSNNKKETK